VVPVRGRQPLARVALASAGVVVVVVVLLAFALRGPAHPTVVVGFTGETLATPPTEPPTVLTEPPTTLPPPDLGRPPLPEPGPAVGLKVANGAPAAPAIEFRSDIPVPDDLVFVLVLGSDARPREDLLRTRADAVQLLALNPRTMQGTIVGIPRDSYVQYPRGGRGKVNDALARGGPAYAVETVRLLTGLPIHYYVLTGFVGLQRMVDDLGGLDVHVDRRMNDRFSGARFERGWHHLVGGEVLAYARNRHDVANGDFTRSEHHGQLLLAGLGKLRSTVADDGGLLQAVGVLRAHARLDVPLDHLPRLAALARRLAPERLSSVVLPGRVGTAGGASVVFLTQDAPRLFADLRDDAVIGPAVPDPSAPPPPTSTSTTTTVPQDEAPPPSTSTTTTAVEPIGTVLGADD
jgi:polyisoprenyl-teichoic acid--peptidoglycan teichoic acid transferase